MKRFKKISLAAALVAVVGFTAAFVFQNAGYRYIPGGIVFSGDTSGLVPTIGAEATFNSGMDTYFQRNSGGGWNIFPSFTLNGGSSVTTTSPTDAYKVVGPGGCAPTLATTAFANGSPAVIQTGTANVSVLNVTTNTTAGTITIDCDLTVDSRSTSGKGVTIKEVVLDYGILTQAMSSIAAPTVASLAYPAVGGTANVTVASAGGSLAVLPASLVVADNTTGKCTPESITFGTPIVENSANVRYTLEQVFTTSGTSATTLQVCGMTIYYTNNIL